VRSLFSPKDLPRMIHQGSRKQDFIDTNNDFGIVCYKDGPIYLDLGSKLGQLRINQELDLASHAGTSLHNSERLY